MKHTARPLVVLLLACALAVAMVLGATTVTAQTSAQATDLCGLPLRGAIGGIDATATPNYGNYPSTYYSGNYGGVNGMYGEQNTTPPSLRRLRPQCRCRLTPQISHADSAKS